MLARVLLRFNAGVLLVVVTVLLMFSMQCYVVDLDGCYAVTRWLLVCNEWLPGCCCGVMVDR